jgi:tetratricopeptide (TPR) repeat protein
MLKTEMRNCWAPCAVLLLAGCGKHPAPEQPASYADPRACEGCHAAIAAAYKKTGMARSFYRLDPKTTVEDFAKNNRFFHPASNTHFEMLQRKGEFFQRRWQAGAGGRETNADELRIDYVMGSGNHVRTYLHRTARGTLIELPLGWYPEHGGTWAMNPGYEGVHMETRRKIAYECMFCHDGYPQVPPHSEEPAYQGDPPSGIDCQRCHGPGADHVRAAQSGGKNPRETIVNPARLSPRRQMEVCMQCHLQSTAEALPSSLRRFDREPFSYNPREPLSAFQLYFDQDRAGHPNERFEIVSSAYRLRQSQCFLKTGEKLVCETCHDPHDIPRGEEAVKHYDSVCKTCHAGLSGAIHTAAENCAGCHMPKRRTDDVVLAVMTDHLIQRPKPGANLLAAKLPSPAATYHGEVLSYYPSQVEDPRDALLVAAAQVLNNSNLTAGIPRLTDELAKGNADAAAYLALGDAWRHSGRPDQAALAYEQAAKRDPASARALRGWGVALKQSGQRALASDKLRQAVRDMPLDPENWYELGLLDSENGQATQAIAELRKAVELDPDLAAAYNNLGGNFARTGQADAAEAAFREAVRIDPYNAQALSNLGMFLAAKGNFAEAQEQVEAATKADPNSAGAHELLRRILQQRHALGQLPAPSR